MLDYLDNFWSIYSNLVLSLGTASLLALSIYLTLSCGMLAMANAAFMGIGAYTASILTMNYGWPFPAAIAAGMAAPALVAVIIGGPTLRLSGVLIGLYSNALFPLMGQPMLHKGIAVIILGGMGDIRGAMLAGLFLGFAEVLSVAYIGSDMRDAVAFGLLFLVLLVRPKGLFGSVQERKV